MAKRNELPRNEEGQKLYPTCNWERNQHILYDALSLAKLQADETHNDIDCEEVDRIERLIEEFNACVIDGTAYMAWEDSLDVKEIIENYHIRYVDRIGQEVDGFDAPTFMGWEEYEGEDYVGSD